MCWLHRLCEKWQMPNFEQNLSICIIICGLPSLLPEASTAQILVAQNVSKAEKDSHPWKENQGTETEGMQILSQLPGLVLWECAPHPFGKISLIRPVQQFQLLWVFSVVVSGQVFELPQELSSLCSCCAAALRASTDPWPPSKPVAAAQSHLSEGHRNFSSCTGKRQA